MIFGFNTDIKQGDTVYHVQSEARQSEHVLQTQVFVRGRCIGKKATPYAAKESGMSESQLEQSLRDQHKLISDAVREGRVDAVLDKQEAPEVLAVVRQLDIQWVNAENVFSDSQLRLQFLVTEGGEAVAGARLVSRLTRPTQDPVYNEAVTGAGGTADMQISLEESALAETSILVQANVEGRTTTRKFQLRKAES